MNYYDTLHYDSDSGRFIWRVARPGCSVGASAGSVGSHGYVCIKLGRRSYRAHRLAWFLVHGEWPDGEIDHINGDKTDNRLCNLRVASRAENSQNRRMAHRDSAHGMLGATWNRQHRKWQSKIVANKVRHHLGYFATCAEAHAAYMAAKALLHVNGG